LGIFLESYFVIGTEEDLTLLQGTAGSGNEYPPSIHSMIDFAAFLQVGAIFICE
jgi:hypothetical protein